jgi:hypothetical protein
LSLVDTDYASFYKDKMRDHWAHIFCGFCWAALFLCLVLAVFSCLIWGWSSWYFATFTFIAIYCCLCLHFEINHGLATKWLISPIVDKCVWVIQTKETLLQIGKNGFEDMKLMWDFISLKWALIIQILKAMHLALDVSINKVTPAYCLDVSIHSHSIVFTVDEDEVACTGVFHARVICDNKDESMDESSLYEDDRTDSLSLP